MVPLGQGRHVCVVRLHRPEQHWLPRVPGLAPGGRQHGDAHRVARSPRRASGLGRPSGERAVRPVGFWPSCPLRCGCPTRRPRQRPPEESAEQHAEGGATGCCAGQGTGEVVKVVGIHAWRPFRPAAAVAAETPERRSATGSGEYGQAQPTVDRGPSKHWRTMDCCDRPVRLWGWRCRLRAGQPTRVACFEEKVQSSASDATLCRGLPCSTLVLDNRRDAITSGRSTDLPGNLAATAKVPALAGGDRPQDGEPRVASLARAGHFSAHCHPRTGLSPVERRDSSLGSAVGVARRIPDAPVQKTISQDLRPSRSPKRGLITLRACIRGGTTLLRSPVLASASASHATPPSRVVADPMRAHRRGPQH